MRPSHTLTAALVLGTLCGTAFGGGFSITRIGHLGGGVSLARDISNGGIVVGDSLLPNGISHAFTFDGSTLTDLDPTRPGVESIAWGVNDLGTVVGQADDFTNPRTAMMWDFNGGTDLGALMGALGPSFAYSINNSGRIAGQASVDGDPFSVPTIFDTSGNVYLSQTQPFNDGGAFLDINEQNVAVGYDFLFFSPDNAIIAAPESPTTYFGALGLREQTGPGSFPYSQATALNEMGTLVGVSNNGSGTELFARWSPIFETGGPGGPGDPPPPPGLGEPGGGPGGGPGGAPVGFDFEILGTIDGYEGGVAEDINESGVIVGWAFNFEGTTPQRAVAYADGRFTDLNTLLAPDSDFEVLIRATGINDQGDIVGWGLTTSGTVEGFVLRGFVPTPGVAALLGFGAMGALRRRR